MTDPASTWSSLATAAPRLAALGRARLEEPGVVLVGTLRRDGAPRISPVEPLLWGDDLWLSMLWGSAKARDLQRDPRVLVHSIVTSRDGRAGEFKLRGQALEETSPRVSGRREFVGCMVPDPAPYGMALEDDFQPRGGTP